MGNSTEAQRAEDAKKKHLRIEQQNEDIRWLMSTKSGRRVMSRLLDFTGVYRSSFTGNSETFFREGQRNVGLHFLADVQSLAPGDYVLMLQEHQPQPNNGGSSRAK